MKISKDSVFFIFSRDNRPAARVSAPCALTLECRDAFDGQIDREDMPVDAYDPSRVNPATGPVYVEGAEPGDALCVKVRSIRLAPVGFTAQNPRRSPLPGQHRKHGRSLAAFGAVHARVAGAGNHPGPR